MLNLVRSDFYRLFRSKAFFVCTFVLVAINMGAAIFLDWVYDAMEGSQAMFEASGSLIKDGLSYGLLSFYGNNSIFYFMLILISIFVTSEFIHGTMKNVVSKGFARYKIYLSKLITLSIAIFLMIFLTFLFGTVTVTIISGRFGELTVTFLLQMLTMIGVEFLLHTAMVSLFIMVAMLTRNNGGSIAIGILGILSLGQGIYILLQWLTQKYFHVTIEFSKYGLMNNIGAFQKQMAPASTDILRAVLVALAFLIVSTSIGIIAFENSDVK